MTSIQFPAKTRKAGNGLVIPIIKTICDIYGIKEGDSFNVILKKIDNKEETQ